MAAIRQGWTFFVILFLMVDWGDSFSLIPSSWNHHHRRHDIRSHHARSLFLAGKMDLEGDTTTMTIEEVEKIRSMRVKDLKDALSQLNIPTKDVFEKEQLVQRLLEARQKGNYQSKKNMNNDDTPKKTTGSRDVIVTKLFFTNMDSNLRIEARNMNGGGIEVNPSEQPYPTIEFDVIFGGGSTFPLRLLVDTACSGFVLRPAVVQRYNLPQMSTPVTMTGAGGTVGATGLTQLSKFSIGGETFGPLPAAVQDIGALPSSLDGIVGLSFLNYFAAVDMDFSNGNLYMYKRGTPVPSAPPSSVQGTLVARGRMDMVPQYGIYTVDTTFGGRGPVKMLVDTGAACTFLNWDGVSDLGISRNDNKFLQRLSNPMGAMGSDNIAMQLTHRLGVSSTLNLGIQQQQRPIGSSLPGLSLAGNKRLQMDIGDIAILESMKNQRVGGILGIDAFMRATCIRFILEGPNKEILIYQ